MRSRLFPILIGVLILPIINLVGQDTIKLNNPSFEGYPGMGDYTKGPPRGWYDCQKKFFPKETFCDVHPNPANPFFGVVKRANHGYTYVGMVVRGNDSWESIAQKLTIPFQANKCYSFSIDLCKSKAYNSRKDEKDPNYYPFVEPVILRIWGGNSYCDKAELLDETDRVSNTDWKTYHFDFSPTDNYTHIILEAFYKTPVLFAYDGNILVDNASSIIMKPCPGEEIFAVVDKTVVEIIPPKKVIINSSKPTQKTESQPKKEEKILKELDIDVLKEGQKVRIENLYFRADSYRIEMESYPVLDEIFTFLEDNKKIKVEIGGHTNQTCTNQWCDPLSEARAKAVCDYLVEKGVERLRLSYKGYGKRFPISEENGQETKEKNQRVEIKILSLQG